VSLEEVKVLGQIFVGEPGADFADRLCPMLSNFLGLGLDKLGQSYQDETWAEFNSRCGHACLCHTITLLRNTVGLKVENSAQTTFRLSPVRFCAPQFRIFLGLC
jgi:hypothetical protein